MNTHPASINAKAIRKALLRFCLGAVGCFMCGCCLANCLKNSSVHLLGEIKDHCNTLNILPTSMMDNDTLFLAASAEKESNMSAPHRLLNNRWLMQSEHNTFSGGTALRAVLKMSAKRFWSFSKTSRSLDNSEENLPKLAVLNWNNYDLELSSDKVVVAFSYRF